MDDIKKRMNINFSYPEQNDPDIQYHIYKKREFYGHKMKTRPKTSKYEDVKEYRDNVCGRSRELLEHQQLLSNFINPNTPNKGCLVFHGTGTGKTCASIAVAEKFKEQVLKYGIKIYVLVSGPLNKKSWKDEFLRCTGETYRKYIDKNIYISKEELEKLDKEALTHVMQYYRLMSYKSFVKKVLGERIVEKVVEDDETIKTIYRKTEEGDYERDTSVDRIYNLNNTLLIVDEAHNLTGNARGEAVKYIIDHSVNLKILLLTATPMKNLADDIIELINLLRPNDDPIERDRVFNSYKNYEMDFKDGGLEYLREKVRGYVSHLRGADPLVFAKRIDKGIKPPYLLFTKLTLCKMLPFQQKLYDQTIKNIDDTLDRRSEAVANFVFPGLSQDKKELVGYSGREGIHIVKNQLKQYGDQINKKLSILLGIPENRELIYLTDDGKTITGNYLKLEYLQNFSTKFHKAFHNFQKLVWGKKGPGTVFVYSNLVKVGIEVVQQIMLMNGYLEYQENYNSYQINSDTICYFCGLSKEKHHGVMTLKTKKEVKTIPDHTFKPATFVTVTGKSSEEVEEILPEEKINVLTNVFNIIENHDGKNIKFVLGSKIMSESITLENVSEVDILDVAFHLGGVDQVIGRAIRHCKHYGIMSQSNPYPTVNVYKYAIASGTNEISTEENLYKKAELKHMLIKKVERLMKEEAIDCPLNITGNMFPEEVEQYKDCGKEGQTFCPGSCDYTQCNYKCGNKRLNDEFYDEENQTYKKLDKDKLDFSTFIKGYARNEIDFAKKKIKEMFLFNYVYTLKNIIEYIKNFYIDDKKELFDSFYVYKALDELVPITENDFNNFKDTIIDKYNRQGFLIYVNQFYIFQPFDQHENVPMYYRTSFDKNISQQISLHDYIKDTTQYKKFKISKGITDETTDLTESTEVYNFNDVIEYYDNRKEYTYVGIIDKEQSQKKSKHSDELIDVFKIREKRSKILDKKRGTGIPSLKGAVCETSKNKEYLEKIAKTLGISFTKNELRHSICEVIKDKLLFLEKYGTDLNKNKMTYIIIPKNHPKYPFPYNLEDRTHYIVDEIKQNIKIDLDIKVKQEKHKEKELKGLHYYVITIKNTKTLKDFQSLLINLGAQLEGDHWLITVK